MSVEVKWNCGENFILFITVIQSALFSVIVNDNNNNNQITIIIVIFLNICIFFFGTEVCRKKLPYTFKEENEIRFSALKVAGHASHTISTGIMGSQRVREFFALGSAPHPAGSRKSPAEAFNPGVRTTCIFLSQILNWQTFRRLIRC